jgi:hypothetical protein
MPSLTQVKAPAERRRDVTSAPPAAHRARVVARAMGTLGTALDSWHRANVDAKPMFPQELFSAVAGGFDINLTYDVDALALVHGGLKIGTADSNPLARTILIALHNPGSRVRFNGDKLNIIAPTERSLAEYQARIAAAKANRIVDGPRLPGVRASNVWYDGTKPLDIGALVGNVSLERYRVVERAKALVNHRWWSSAANTHHGLLVDGVWSDTPDETFIEGGFKRCGENIGLPYFWGGFSDPASFDRGIRAGLPAGHIFKITKTFREDNPFTPIGLGVDCSGFVSQAWGLPYKIATGEIQERTKPLDDYAQLQPGDVCMKVWQHVMLFVGRRDDKLLFMESTPPRCIGQAFTADELRAMEMLPRAATWLDEPK